MQERKHSSVLIEVREDNSKSYPLFYCVNEWFTAGFTNSFFLFHLPLSHNLLKEGCYELRRAVKTKRVKGFSQEDVAKKIGVTRQAVYKWENDKSYPDIDNFILLSEMYNVTLDELIKGNQDFKRKYIVMQKMRILRKEMNLVLYWMWFASFKCFR